jgi:hypothetical protein
MHESMSDVLQQTQQDQYLPAEAVQQRWSLALVYVIEGIS